MEYWPQYIFIILQMIGLGIIIAKHGQPKSGNENAWTSIMALIITYILLYFGGFFDGMF